VQHAIIDANDGDEIVVPEGEYVEKFDFAGKALTVRSSAPDDPAVIAATVLRSYGNTVSFLSGEDAGSVLLGLTIAGGAQGIVCSGASPTISDCRIMDHHRAGVTLLSGSSPTIEHCDILGNGAAGINAPNPPGGGRIFTFSEPLVHRCLIAGNQGEGIRGGRPTLSNCSVVENLLAGVDASVLTMTNSIVYFNGVGVGGTQIDSPRATITYSDVQGGWPGDGNIDADPLFAASGSWAMGRWTAGDYHLMSEGWRWDRGLGDWVSDAATSPCIDAGDPTSELLDEPLTSPTDPSGANINERINMGAYGGTAEASLMRIGQ